LARRALKAGHDNTRIMGLVSHDDGPLRVESGNFGHGGESGEEQSTE
jgi:hypothetical protein